jgi:phosphate ABC transporter phosphate-binding protein
MTTKITTIMTSILVIVAMITITPSLTANAQSTPDTPISNLKFDITGAGATFPFPLIDLWRVEYHNDFDNVNLNYQSIGSGGGIKQHIEKTVNFAASDAPLTDKERDLAPGTLHIPETIGGVVVAYNIPEIPDKGLKLTGKTISHIFMGNITRWNDPEIANLNPGLNLPDQDIIVAHRSDGSGTTFVFTDYLSTVDPDPGWAKKVGKGKSVPWPVGLAAAGNEGVAGIIKSTTYSIGYVELAYAFQTNMSYAYVQNGDKSKFIAPSIESVGTAAKGVVGRLPAAEANWSAVSIVNAPGSDSYPISSLTYLLVYDDVKPVSKNKDQAKALVHMIYWMITDGQQFSPSLMYVPLPDEIVELDKKGLSKITYDGEVLWKYDGPVKTSGPENPTTQPKTSDYKIPDWIRNNAKWWGDGLITDQDYIKGLQYLISQGILKV